MTKNVEKWVSGKDLEEGFIYYTHNKLNYLTETDKKLKMGDTYHNSYSNMTEWLIGKGILEISDSIDIDYETYIDLFESCSDLFAFELLKTVKEVMTPDQLIYKFYRNYLGDAFGWYDEEASFEELTELVMDIHYKKSDMFVDYIEDGEHFEKFEITQDEWEEMDWRSQEDVYWKNCTDFEKVKMVFDDEEIDAYFDEAVIALMKRFYQELGLDIWPDYKFEMFYLTGEV